MKLLTGMGSVAALAGTGRGVGCTGHQGTILHTKVDKVDKKEGRGAQRVRGSPSASNTPQTKMSSLNVDLVFLDLPRCVFNVDSILLIFLIVFCRKNIDHFDNTQTLVQIITGRTSSSHICLDP